MFSSVIKLADRLTTPRENAGKNELMYWRERTLLIGMLIAVVIGLFAYLEGVPRFIRDGTWGILVVDTVAYSLVVFMFICRRLPYVIRAGGSVLILYTLGAYLLARFGFYGSGFTWLFAFPVLACVLLGLRAAFFGLAITLLTMGGIDYFLAMGWIKWDVVAANPVEQVISNQIDYLLLSITAIAFIGFLLNRLQEALASDKAHRETLEAEIAAKANLESALRESEQKYRMYFESASDVIYTLDTALNVINVSPSVTKVLGFTPEKLVGVPFAQAKVVAPEYLELALSDCRQVLAGHSVDNVYEFVTKKGGRILGEIHAAPLVRDGRIVGIVNVGRDITAISQAMDALERSQNRFWETLELLPSIAFEMNPELIITYINSLGLKTFGYTDDVLEKGFNVLDVVHPADQGKFQRAFKKLKKQGQINPFIIRFISAAGTEIEALVHSALISQNNTVMGFRVSLNDITAQKNMEAELQKVRKLESVGVLAGGIAHDFNNLLVSILGNVSLALNGMQTDHPLYRLLKDAEQASMNARDLTGQLLTFSKGGEPVKEVAAIKDVIQDSVDFVLRGKNVRPVYQFNGDLLPVEIDKGQISQVMQNIVINGAQAMPDGGEIRISAENYHADALMDSVLTDAPYVRIVIQDTGAGIPEDIIDKVFDPYFTTKQDGSGLGLAITHSIVSKHGGHISVTSEAGKTTTFTIYLLAARSSKPVAVKEPDFQPEAGSGKIMIMDDEQMIRTIVSQMLSAYGYEVVSACNGQEAIERYQEENIDATIMDLTIPGAMGGKEAVSRIREIDPEAKVIVSSGYSNDPIMANYIKYGFCAAIAKPYRLRDLIKVVSQVLAQ